VRLVRAEVLKIVRRRGLMAWTLILTIGAVLLTEIVLVLLHAFNPGHHGPAGGQTNLSHYLDVLLGLGTVASILVGATAGSQDVVNGVFRDLVVTGRSRAALFNVRAPGVLVVLLPIVAAGFALAVGGAFAFAGGLPHPAAGVIGSYAAFVFASVVVNVVLAVGLASFASSRVVVGVLIAWNVILGPLLTQIGSLGAARKAIDIAAIDHFGPDQYVNDSVTMSTLTALAVLVAWIAVFNGAGRLSTNRRDA
jgi:hypothetical protein